MARGMCFPWDVSFNLVLLLQAGGTRYGDLSLRQQRLTLTMLDTLRTEKAGILLSLVRSRESTETFIMQEAGKYHPPCSELVYLHIQVTNLTSKTNFKQITIIVWLFSTGSSLVFTVDVSIDPREHFIHDGVLRDIPVGRLEAQESREVELAVCFLCHGRFEVFASARVLDSGTLSGSGSARLIAIVDTNTWDNEFMTVLDLLCHPASYLAIKTGQDGSQALHILLSILLLRQPSRWSLAYFTAYIVHRCICLKHSSRLVGHSKSESSCLKACE